MTKSDVSATTRADQGDVDLGAVLEQHRVGLTGYCYRMLGSSFEAEDAVQEAFVRAWRSYDRFEGRSALKSWLYRIATNVCIDALNGRNRRERPVDMAAAQNFDDARLGEALPEERWIEPMPDDRVLPERSDPAEVAVSRDSVRLAFVAALQYLPPRQRSALILKEVLRWKATEVADLLETSVASVNSALQRARSTLADVGVSAETFTGDSLTDDKQELLKRYMEAFESYDMAALVKILHDDAAMSMPPYALWLRGHHDIRAWMLGPGIACAGSKLVPVEANGQIAFGQYHATSTVGVWEPWALQVIDTRDGKINDLVTFLDTQRWFPYFGLPDRITA